MIDPTRLAAIKAMRPTPGKCEAPLRDLGSNYFDHDYEVYPPLGEAGPVAVFPRPELAEFFVAAADPEYGLQALAAEVERLQEREKPVKMSIKSLMAANRFIDPPSCKCGQMMMDHWSYCPNCGRSLEWS